ncbi:MAG: hypothetical protein HY073_02125 [Deltaproteobacteria bacterium]|nr:hypothetical protein [Deltaproteobacteria bacterium]
MDQNKTRLQTLSLPLKVLITCFVGTLLLGYVAALLQVFDRTHFDMAHTLLYYRGAETGAGTGEDAGLMLPPSFKTLLSVTHVHSLSQPVMFGLLGFLFTLSMVTDAAKVIFILLPFIGSVVSNLSPWLIRFGTKGMVILLPLSQLAMTSGFFVMSFVVLYDLWFRKEEMF